MGNAEDAVTEECAKIIACELAELTADQRKVYEWPDHFNGDITDRARSCAGEIIRQFDWVVIQRLIDMRRPRLKK